MRWAYLNLLGNKIPASLKIFLTALAIVDDLGAIIVIALFYVGDFSLLYLVLALGIFAGLQIFRRFGVRRLALLPASGGCHVVLYAQIRHSRHHCRSSSCFAIPFGNGDEESPSYKLQHFLHKPVAFVIMPIFALANTGITLTGNWIEGLSTSNSLGIFAGLFAGKPLGIVLFSLLAVKLGLSQLPNDISWKHIIGTGFLGGIGFTMSIFITLLAFGNPEIVQNAKISIIVSSILAGTVGFLILNHKSGTANLP